MALNNSINKITLTQKNYQYETFKLYKEHLHLHPLSPKPSLRHMPMWAIQSSCYVMGWQFSFNGQLNWIAAEANWRLLMEPSAAMNYEIADAACFVQEHRGGRPGEWANGIYAHRLGGPPSLRRLSPLPYKAAAPKGLAFCFLNYFTQVNHGVVFGSVCMTSRFPRPAGRC